LGKNEVGTACCYNQNVRKNGELRKVPGFGMANSDRVAIVEVAPVGMAFAGKSASQKYHDQYLALPILRYEGSMFCINSAYGV
jgi:hypothetical protein